MMQDNRIVHLVAKDENGDVCETLRMGPFNAETAKIEPDCKEEEQHDFDSQGGEVSFQITSDTDVNLNERLPFVKQEIDDTEKRTVIDIKPDEEGLNLAQPVPIEVKIEGQGSQICYWRKETVKYDIKQASDTKIKEPSQEDNSLASDSCIGEELSSKDNLTGQLKESDQNYFKCNVCGKEFKHQCRLTYHIQKHSKERPFNCKECGRTFKYRSDWSTHMRNVHVGAKLYNCDRCGEGFEYQIDLKLHMPTHYNIIPRPHVCNICEKAYQFEGALTRHMRTHNKDSEKPDPFASEYEDYRVKQLGGPTTTDSDLLGPSEDGDPNKPHKCKICGKSFTQKSGVSTHMKIHSGEKPHSCKECGRRFTHQSNLTAHMRTHSGEKPFVCNICEKRFAQQASLITHKMIHSKQKPFKCNICERAFTGKHDLSIHLRRHSGERPFICDICGSRFISNHELTRHIKRHSSEGKNASDFCGKTFTRQRNMTEHMKVQSVARHEQRLHTCTVCLKNFTRKYGLNKHMKLHNKE